MCGRLTHTLTPEDYATYVDLVVPEVEPNWDVRPTDTLPIIRMKGGRLECAPLRWGFSLKGSKVLINARSETVDQLPSFRDAYRTRRALLMVSGWYEWKDKQRYLVQRKDYKPVVMAALWCAKAEGDQFTVLTCAAGEDLEWLHHRVPVILERKNWRGWLKGQPAEAWLRPFPAGPLVVERFGVTAPKSPPSKRPARL